MHIHILTLAYTQWYCIDYKQGSILKAFAYFDGFTQKLAEFYEDVCQVTTIESNNLYVFFSYFQFFFAYVHNSLLPMKTKTTDKNPDFFTGIEELFYINNFCIA